MNETTILLSGDPKAKPDFLATVEPLKQPPFNLPFQLVLDGYTREPWSSGQNNIDTTKEWQSCYLVSTDGRNRLPGFMQYLQGRRKAAVAKFKATDASKKAVLVIPYDGPPIPTEGLPQGVDKSQVIFAKYLRDENILLGKGDDDAQKKKQQQMLQQQQQQKLIEEKKRQSQSQKKAILPQCASSSNKTGGLLGNLLGKQRRTDTHLDIVRASKTSNDITAFDPTAGAAGCINSFRNKVSADLEKFKADPTTVTTKISISLGSLIKTVPTDERDKVTMEVLKFAAYEMVEEVGLDRWIAAKEPTDFMDECVINVYKEGHCPEDVLEDLNKGELPDEIRGQTRHIVESQSKAIERKGKKQDEELVKQSIAGEDNVVVLNTNKRDRRTLEQIQKDLEDEGEDVKRSRFE